MSNNTWIRLIASLIFSILLSVKSSHVESPSLDFHVNNVSCMTNKPLTRLWVLNQKSALSAVLVMDINKITEIKMVINI